MINKLSIYCIKRWATFGRKCSRSSDSLEIERKLLKIIVIGRIHLLICIVLPPTHFLWENTESNLLFEIDFFHLLLDFIVNSTLRSRLISAYSMPEKFRIIYIDFIKVKTTKKDQLLSAFYYVWLQTFPMFFSTMRKP